MPPELVLLPASSPINIFAFSYWARVAAVGIMVLRHHRPVYNSFLPEDFSLNELSPDLSDKKLRFTPSMGKMWASGETGRLLCSLGGKVLGLLGPVLRRALLTRRYALAQCMQFILQRLDEGGYGSFWNSNFVTIMAFRA